MGEKLSVLTTIELPHLKMDVELNQGTATSKTPLYIHLQNERFRLNIPDYQYLQIALAIHIARGKLESYKKLEDTDETDA